METTKEFPPALVLPYIDDFIIDLSAKSGMQFDVVLFLFLLFLSHFLGFAYRFINGAKFRHFWGLLFGIPFQFIMYREKILIWWIPCAITYFLIRVLRKNSIIPVVLLNVGLLKYLNYEQYVYRYLSYECDVTTVMMMGVLKVVSLAFCVSDGEKSDAEIKEYAANIIKNPKSKHRKNLVREVKERQVLKMPSFFEYFAYMNNFQNGFSGPYVDYMEYDNWIKMKGCYANIPFTVKPLIRSLFYTVLFGYFYAVICPSFPVDYLLSDEWKQTPFLKKYTIVFFTSFLVRSRYHFVWNWMQICSVSSGIAYGKDDKGRDRWNFIDMQDSRLELAFSSTVKEKVDMWNISCTKFFRRYCYNRFIQYFHNTFICMCLVFLCNSLWHGIYPGYWLITPCIALTVETGKCGYRFWNNKLKGSSFISDQEVAFISGLFFGALFSFGFLFMEFMEWYKIKQFMDHCNWFPFTAPLVVLLFFKITGYGQRSVSSQKTAHHTTEK